jgi:hypothetical protein
MAELKIIYDEDEMTEEEHQEFVDQIRNLVHGEWWGQYSATVIGPLED